MISIPTRPIEARSAVEDGLRFLLLEEEMPFAEMMAQVERVAIIAVLKHCRNNKLKAARQLRVHRNTLTNRMTALDIPPLTGRLRYHGMRIPATEAWLPDGEVLRA